MGACTKSVEAEMVKRKWILEMLRRSLDTLSHLDMKSKCPGKGYLQNVINVLCLCVTIDLGTLGEANV